MSIFCSDPQLHQTRGSESVLASQSTTDGKSKYSRCIGLSLLIGLLGLVPGCSDSPPITARLTDVERSVGVPPGGGDPGSLSEAGVAAPELRDLNGDKDSRLAGFRARNREQADFEATLGQYDRDQSVQLVQQGGKPELVPTPRPRPDAEVVPTPKGTPDSKTAEKPTGPIDYTTWPTPDVTLVVTGQQHGYIEPCGCTGLDKQKGGVARRLTFMNRLRESGWELFPIDAGNQVRRIGQQAAIKFSWSSEALKRMKYQAVGFGPDDLRLSAIDLVQVAAADSEDDAMYTSANLVIIDPSFMPTQRVVERGGLKIGITTILDPESLDSPVGEDFEIKPPEASAREALKAMNESGADFRVLSFFGSEDKSEEEAKALAVAVPGFDLIIAAGGYGEPTFQPQEIEGSKTKLIVPGNKAMYAGLVALYKDAPMKYARVALTHEFEDAPEMRRLMADYQQQLEDIGLEGLGLRPVRHSSGEQFVGSAVCGECHTSAFDVWEGTPHADTTQSIVKPPRERGDIARHFDPECISCHVTGWNPQRYFPYETGYLSLSTEHLHGSGCENCHGPGSSHSKAEMGDSTVSDEERDRLRASMRLPLEKAREHCMECHDLDNSPDFHEEDAFEDVYWPEIEHYGMD